MLFIFCLFISAAASLQGMEKEAPGGRRVELDLLEFTGTSETDILNLVESLMLQELATPTRSAPPRINSLADRLKSMVNAQCNPHDRIRLSRIFRLIKINPILPLYLDRNDHVIPPTSLTDLDVIIGSSNPSHSIASRVKNTHTHIGYATLCRHLVQVKSAQNILKLQNEVQRLISTGILAKVRSLLSDMRDVEDMFLSYWVQTDLGASDVLADTGDQQKFKRLPFGNDAANDSVFLTEIGQIGNFVFPTTPILMSAGTLAVGAATANPFMAVSGAFFGILKLLDIPQNIETAKCQRMALLLMQDKLIALRIYVEKLEALKQLLTTHHFPAEILAPLALPTSLYEISRLVELLKTDTFKDESSFWSNWGRICVAFNLMMSQRDQFINSYKGIGTVDFLASVAELLHVATPTTPFCAAIYNLPESAPHIIIDGGWSVLVTAAPASIVPNDIQLGAPQTQCHVITGPNARGKTTILRTTACATLLGCTLGFGSASTLIMPEHMTFLTSINVKDDPANNLSLFQAGVKRLAVLCKTAQSKPNRACLIILDEPFTGTNREVSEACAREFILRLGECPNALMLVTSHLANVAGLETEFRNLFANFHVAEGYRYRAGTDPSEDYNDVALSIINEAMSDAEFTARIRATLDAARALKASRTPSSVSAATPAAAAAAPVYAAIPAPKAKPIARAASAFTPAAAAAAPVPASAKKPAPKPNAPKAPTITP